MRRRLSLVVTLAVGAGCHLIGDFSHLRIRGEGEGGGDCAQIDCATLGLTCGEVIEPCSQQVLSCDTATKDGEETDVDCGGPIERCETRCLDDRACGNADDCVSSVCVSGVCQAPSCGDMVVNGTETCEDGNTESYDGCSAICAVEDGHLLISEVVFEDDASEFIEIHNPTDATVGLTDHYLANYPLYYAYADDDDPSAPDVVLGFPVGATIGPRDFVVVSLETASAFDDQYGALPDYAMEDSEVPAMVNADPAGKMGNDASMVVLFYWDGRSDLVTDIDYLLYGTTEFATDKSGETVGASTYADETPARMQSAAPKVPSKQALFRCDTAESTELAKGGNGQGHDETSEDCARAFAKATTPTPGMAPVPADRGPCP